MNFRKMWDIVLKVIKKAVKYTTIAFTGYEIGDHISGSTENNIVKETTIIREQNSDKNLSDFFIIIVAVLFFGIICATTGQIFKCIANKNKNNNSSTTNIQLEAQIPAPQTAPRRQ